MKKQPSFVDRLKSQKILSPVILLFKQIQNSRFYNRLKGKIGVRRLKLLLGSLGFLFLFILFKGWDFHSSKKDLSPPIPVMVASIKKQDVPLYLNTIGTVTALKSVSVKTQVNGRLTEIYFQEGQVVKKGDLLAQIDSQPYEAQLKQYEGQLIKDEALLENARLDLKRYQKLHKEDSISRQTLDTQNHLVKQYEGVVKSDQGLVDGVKVTLGYCKIVSDIEGVIGLQQVNQGNLVQTTDSIPLTTINTISPISVLFPIPEDDLPQVHTQFQKAGTLGVDVFDRKGEVLLDTGQIIALDSQIDSTTGTLKVKAVLPNEKKRLYHNQFVNVRIKVDTLKEALVIPTAALQTGAKGPFVYVLNPQEHSVHVEPVTIKASLEELTAIEGGLSEGQSIIIQGQDKLTEGSKVSVSPPSHTSGDA